MLLFRHCFVPVVILLVLSPVLAQQAKPAEPDAQDVIYLLDSSDQTLKPLPKETAKTASKVDSHSGSTSVKAAIQIPGSASSFHVKGGNDLEFVIKCEIPPAFLLPFTQQGNNREGVISSVKTGGFGVVKENKKFWMPFAVSKYGESSWRLVVKAPDAGEYGFVIGYSVFDFAVDPK
ncbi:MAG: hypothetical protein ABSF70_08665 [Terracidiphilus sp.]|jgi:hypothetical protein